MVFSILGVLFLFFYLKNENKLPTSSLSTKVRGPVSPVRKPLTNTTRRNNVRPVDISKINNPRKSYKGKTNTSSKIIIKENYTIRFFYIN